MTGPAEGRTETKVRPVEAAFVVAAVAAGAALAYGHALRVTGGHLAVPTYPDEKNYYLDAARRIAEDPSRFFSSDRLLWNGPLWPLVVAGLGGDVRVVRALSVLAAAAAAVLVWDAARIRSGGRAAAVALLLFVLHPPLWTLAATALTEPFFTFLLAGVVWLLGRGRPFPAGICLGAATLVRPTAQFLAPWTLAAAAAVWAATRRAGRGQGDGAGTPSWAVKLLVGTALVVLPYAARNYLVLGEAKIANGFGAVLFLGNDLRKDGTEPVYSGQDFDTIEITAPFTHLDTEGDRRLAAAAAVRAARLPFDTAVRLPGKAFAYLFGTSDHYFFPGTAPWHLPFSADPLGSLVSVVSLLTTALLTSAGLVGIGAALLGRAPDPRPSPPASFAAAAVTYFTALHAVSFPIPRLALPLHPIFALFAGPLLASGPSRARAASVVTAACVVAGVCLSGAVRDRRVVGPEYYTYFDNVAPTAPGAPSATNDLAPAEGGGFEVTGADPWLVFPAAELPGRNAMFLLTVKSTCDGDAQLFWGRRGAAFREEDVTPFRLRAGDGVTYRLIPPAGRAAAGLTSVRFDPPGTKGCRVVVTRSATVS